MICRSAREEESKSKSKSRPVCCINEKRDDLLHEGSIATTFIEPIYDNDHGGDRFCHGRDRFEDEFFDLILETLGGNRTFLHKSILHRRLNCRHERGELVGKGGEKLGRITAIRLPPRKKE